MENQPTPEDINKINEEFWKDPMAYPKPSLYDPSKKDYSRNGFTPDPKF